MVPNALENMFSKVKDLLYTFLFLPQLNSVLKARDISPPRNVQIAPGSI